MHLSWTTWELKMSFSPSAHWQTNWKSLICNTAPGRPVKRFFTLLKLNITFCFRCYLHHNCNINPNWNYAQLYSPVKPLPNVPSSVFWFVFFVFLYFCAELALRNQRKSGSVMHTSKWVRKKYQQWYQSACVETCS